MGMAVCVQAVICGFCWSGDCTPVYKMLSSSRAPGAASSEDQITRGRSFPQLTLNVFPPTLWDSIKTPFCLWRRPGGLDKATQSKQHWRGWSAALQGERLPNGALAKETRCCSAGPDGAGILGGLQRSLHRTLRWCSFSPDFCFVCSVLRCAVFAFCNACDWLKLWGQGDYSKQGCPPPSPTSTASCYWGPFVWEILVDFNNWPFGLLAFFSSRAFLPCSSVLNSPVKSETLSLPL